MKMISCIMICGFWLLTLPVQSKPGVPVSIRIEAQNAGEPGTVINFVVTAISQIDTDNLQINIQLPGGAELVSGDSRWRGRAIARQPVSIEFSAVLPPKGQPVKAVAVINGSGHSSFMARSFYYINKPVSRKQQKIKSQYIYRNGQRLIEFPVKNRSIKSGAIQ